MNQVKSPIVDEIWSLIRENQRGMERFNKGMEQFSKKMEELRASQRETEEMLKKRDEQIDRADKKLNKIFGDMGNDWGALGENLTKGNLAKRLKERGIQVEKVTTRLKKPGDSEYDILALNGKEAVLVEVKSTFRKSDVQKFKRDIERFKLVWPEYKNKTLYGAISYSIRASKEAIADAKQEGFFVLSATGDVIVENAKNFKPKVFH